MRDICIEVPGGVLTGRIREWEDLDEYARKEITGLLARILVENYLHPPPHCRFCLTQDCPALKCQGECPAERPIKWLPRDQPRRRGGRRGRKSRMEGQQTPGCPTQKAGPPLPIKQWRKSLGYRGALSQGGRLVAILRAAIAHPSATTRY
jgi:hypothetical protein